MAATLAGRDVALVRGAEPLQERPSDLPPKSCLLGFLGILVFLLGYLASEGETCLQRGPVAVPPEGETGMDTHPPLPRSSRATCICLSLPLIFKLPVPFL